jgi:aspartate carbamoyltransferase catalytic subunit
VHLISIDDLSGRHRTSSLSDGFLEVSSRPIKKVPTLRGRTVINMFFEASTRALTSFRLAGKRLSADVVGIKRRFRVSKGESLRTLSSPWRYRGHTCAPDRVGACRMATRYTNSGGQRRRRLRTSHPICSISTVCRVWAAGGLKWHRRRVLRSAWPDPSSVSERWASTCVWWVAHPHAAVSSSGAFRPHDLDALNDVDVVYLLRMQLERAKGAVPPVPSLREYSRVWGLSSLRLRSGQRMMHPGPINRGVELTGDLADDDRSLILHQVESGLAVRMAILYHVLAPHPAEPLSGEEPIV